MKKILIPVDFSSYSHLALNVGIKLARVVNADIHLLHVVTEFSDIISNSFQSEIKESLKLNIGTWALELLEDMKSTVIQENIECRIKCEFGTLISGIENTLRDENYEMIIMGSHGASGKEEWFLGSNAQKVIRQIHKNVLVIKQDMPKLDFSKVVYATGLSLEDKYIFKRFIKFLEPFNVNEIHLLNINTLGFSHQSKNEVDEIFEDFKIVAEDKNITTHMYPDFTIESGVRHFSEEYGINLIGISNIKKHPVKRLFLGSNVEMLVNHSSVPVLSFDSE